MPALSVQSPTETPARCGRHRRLVRAQPRRRPVRPRGGAREPALCAAHVEAAPVRGPVRMDPGSFQRARVPQASGVWIRRHVWRARALRWTGPAVAGADQLHA